MEKELTKIEGKQEIPIISKEKLCEYLQAFGLSNQLTKEEQQLFIEIAQASNLNPFKREIYCVLYVSKSDGKSDGKRNLSIITGYETYVKRANSLKLLDGWGVSVSGTGNLMKAIITIHRKDWARPFIHEVDFSEYNQNNKMWNGKPKTMLKKVAVAQGFRLCFPEEYGGMPYTSDELPDEMTKERDITPQAQTKVQSEDIITIVEADIVDTEETVENNCLQTIKKFQALENVQNNPALKYIVGYLITDIHTHFLLSGIIDDYKSQDIPANRASCVLRMFMLHPEITAYKTGDGKLLNNFLNSVIDKGDYEDIAKQIKACYGIIQNRQKK